MRERKNSGIEWIGDIPVDWEIRLVKNVFDITRGRVIAKTDIDADKRDDMYPVYSSQTANNGVLGYIPTYDFAVDSLTWTTDGAKAGTVFLRRGKYSITNVCGILTPKADDCFLDYLYYSVGYSAHNCRRADINGFKIMSNEMAVIPIVIPQIEEQRKICEYLNITCRKIDELIKNVQAQIEKLKSYKQSLVTDAVTKGLDPSASTKDSGVEWLGQIKESFSVCPIRSIFKIKKEIIGREPDTVLSITQNGLKIKNINENGGQMAESYANYQIVNVGDFAMNHMDLLTGGVGISEYEGVTSPDYRVFVKRNSKYNSRYFLYLFEMYYRNKIFYAFGQGAANVGRWRLPAQNFNTLAIPVPPIEEQEEIAAFLDSKCSSINKLIENKQKKIDKLLEYKQSIIYEYITGKKEVV